MEQTLLEQLGEITPEERRLLSGEELNRGLYTADRKFVVQKRRVVLDDSWVAVRTHTRFTDFPLHGHDYLEMMYVAQGQICHQIDGKELILREGELLVMNRHLLHAIKKAQAQDIGINFIVSDAFLNSLLADLGSTRFEAFFTENQKDDGRGEYLQFRIAGCRPAENLMENLLLELTKDSFSELILTRTAAVLFMYLASGACPLLSTSGPATRAQRQQQEISEYLKVHYPTASLTELADRLHLSPPYLSHLIRKYFGRSFIQLVLEYRLEAACRMLEETRFSVDEIIVKVGYENGSYFHRKFRERCGMTPLQYRSLHAKAGQT